MWGLRVVGLVAAAAVLGGCAGSQARKDLARLQSQLGLLDERVTQLERLGIGSALPEESLGEPAMGMGTTVTGSAPAKRKASISASTKGPSLKPATREIQQALKNAGFYQGAVDGKMGPVTREAIKEFQRVHGLVDDGLVGGQTWAKLKAYAELSAESDELGAAEILK